MKQIISTLTGLAAIVLASVPVFAQEYASGAPPVAKAPDTARPAPAIAQAFNKTVPGVRAYDKRGLNVFEPAKPTNKFTGPTMDIGAAFSQSFQALDHSNTAAPKMVGGKDVNKLITIGAGLPLASANLVLNAQVANGILVSLENYLAARGHEQFYVKGGYLQIDASPIDFKPLTDLMKFTTVKVGMFENNFGDSHFRRSDAGQAIYNPFVGNLIVDPFTTEAGAEIYLRKGPGFIMGAVTSGEMRGAVASPEKRGWARYGKAGFDNNVSEDLRIRLTGSVYRADKSLNQTIYSGDRPGSRYYDVLVDSVGRDRWSGSIQPGFRNSVTAVQINPFIRFKGLEMFGSFDCLTATGADSRSTSPAKSFMLRNPTATSTTTPIAIPSFKLICRRMRSLRLDASVRYVELQLGGVRIQVPQTGVERIVVAPEERWIRVGHQSLRVVRLAVPIEKR